MSPTEAGLLTVASFATGVINAIAGGGTLVTFPALLACGLDPITANATNTVALWPGSLAAMYALRRDLPAAMPWIRILVPSSLLGGLAGAALLLVTPSRVFAALVPFLILFATAVFAFQTQLQRWFAPNRTSEVQPGWRPGFLAVQFGLGIYAGYFGAGFGIMMIAALSLLGMTSIMRMIVLRNVCAFAANGIAAVYFVAGTAVSWPHIGVLMLGQVVGGYFGARLTRRLPAAIVRRLVVGIGLTIGVWLLTTWR
jgi:uncharacterized protein